MLDKVFTEATPRLVELHKNYNGRKSGKSDSATYFDNTNAEDETGYFSATKGDSNSYWEYKEYTHVSEQEFIEFMELEDNVNKPNHYTQGGIEPIDYILANDMNFLEGNVIKYVTRYKHKNGLEDLKKAEFYLKKLIEEFAELK